MASSWSPARPAPVRSTTLYSVLSKLNSGEKNILTIEDPVEYELAGITQVGVNPKAGLTFAARPAHDAPPGPEHHHGR